MDADRILRAGESGTHLLFDTDSIGAAFGADPELLRRVVTSRRPELEAVLAELLALDRAEQARSLIAELAPELRHVLVWIYFELLETRMRQRGLVLH